MSWANLRGEIEEEFGEYTTRESAIVDALERRRMRPRPPAWIWWQQKRGARRLEARKNKRCADPRCGRLFTGKRSDSKYCSHTCRDRWRAVNYQRQRRAAKPAAADRTCPMCTAPVRRRRRDAIYCSVPCNRVACARTKKGRV